MKAVNLIQELKTHANPEKAKDFTRFFKTAKGEYGESDKFLGVNVPVQRKIARKYISLNLQEIQKLLQSKYHEVRHTAAILLVYKAEKSTQADLHEIANLYLDNLSCFNNWDIIDNSAPKVLGPFLQDKSKDILYDLARSDDLWEKRIAMITCYHFIRNEEYSDALYIAKILLHDDHDLIHKAVGWMLREVGNRNREAEERFLKQHYKEMPRTMLRYAIEKFEEPLRKKYLDGEV